MRIHFIIFNVVSILFILAAIFLQIRASYVTKLRMKYINAVYEYKKHCIYDESTPLVDFSDIREWNSCVGDFFKWKTLQVLPKSKYEIIEKYIIK